MKTQDVKAVISGATDPGMVRHNNEDRFIATELWGGSHLLLAAIDGIGGYEGGEVAAAIAADVITQTVGSGSPADCLNLLKTAVTAANNRIVEQKQTDATRSRMGCVLSCAIIDIAQRRLYMVHIGDSRLYSYTASQGLNKLSHDHSLVGYREEMGLISEEEAMRHPQRNIIDRSLGEEIHSASDSNFLDSGIFPILETTTFLFCSDGLSDMLPSSVIESVLSSPIAPKQKVNRLIRMANEAGGKDNVTAVIAEILLPTSPTSPKLTELHFPQGSHVQRNDESETTTTIDFDNDNESGKSGFRRTYLMIIAIAVSFILGGTAGYFIGRYAAEYESQNAKAETVVPDSVIAVPNTPTDSVANAQQFGQQVSDSINSTYRQNADSTLKKP